MQSKIEPGKSKKIIIFILLSITTLIIASGLLFGIYSFLYKISFRVLNSNISGVVFGLLVIYLGIRNFLSVLKLKKELYKSTSTFSWNNFKKHKSVY